MSHAENTTNRLSRPVGDTDHVLGDPHAPITLLEYGSYDCPHCRAANERIVEVRDQLGNRLRYAFRHRPVTGSDIARRAADLIECVQDPDQFWDAHVALMTRSKSLTEEDLAAVSAELGLDRMDPVEADLIRAKARARVDQDIASARESDVRFTPTFFINNLRYDGPWDETSFTEALLGSLGHRVRTAALSFASWAPSTGFLLLLAGILAIVAVNSESGPAFQAFWDQPFSLSLGESEFSMSLLHWVNDALLTIFFLVVGLEIKREFTVGSLASRRAAALPIAAAIGGMAVPALIYFMLAPAEWSHGWGVPMATDTAFAVALIAMMGSRVPVELRVFLTAAAIVDDIGAIIVVAIFYSGEIHFTWLGGAVLAVGLLALLNRASIYNVVPYLLVGALLWVCVHAAGLHATLAGVVLAAFIPTRPPPDFRALMIQADSILNEEARHGGEQFRHGPSVPVLRALDAIHDRMESPADRMLRNVAPRSSYIVLPIFALANAGVVISLDMMGGGHEMLMLAIIAGLVIGKPLGFVLFSSLAVWSRLAQKPAAYSWRQLFGGGALAGIGFTMSLFIAGQSFPGSGDFSAAKVAVFSASVIAAIAGVWILWNAPAPQVEPEHG